MTRSSALRFVALVNAGLVAALACLWLSMALRGDLWRADFRAFYTGWAMVLDGQGGRLYDLGSQDVYQRRVLPELPADEGLLPFVHPPHAALAMSPLALLPRDAAFAVWTALQLALCVIGARFLLRLLGDQSDDIRRTALLSVAAFPPLFMTFQLGQVTLLCVACVLGFVVALKEGRPLPMAAWLLLGSVKPQLMVVPVVVLLARGRVKALAWLAALSLLAAGPTTLILGPACWTDYLALLRFCTQQFGTSGIDPAGMYNLKGLLAVSLGPNQADLVNLLTSAAWLLGLAVVLALFMRTDADLDGRLALALLLGVFVNPHVNPADALAFVPAAALFFAHLARRGSATAFGAMAVAAPVLFLLDYYLLAAAGLPVRLFVLLSLASAGWMALDLLRGEGRLAAAARAA